MRFVSKNVYCPSQGVGMEQTFHLFVAWMAGVFPRSLSQVELREHYSHHWSSKIEACNLVVMVAFAPRVCMVWEQINLLLHESLCLSYLLHYIANISTK